MLDFHTYVARHGESAVQAIIERIERNENIRSVPTMPLEQRWDMLMQGNKDQQRQAA